MLSLMIPLPMVPLLYYADRKKFVREFVNRWATTIIALVLTGATIAPSVYLLLTL